MPDARVIEVPIRSVIVLTGVEFPYDDENGSDTSVLRVAKEHIAEAIGHDQFAIIALGEGGDVYVDSVEDVLDLVAQATSQ